MATATRQKRPPMTEEESRTFQGFSVANAARVMLALEQRGCACEPYADVFTFRRWLPQGRVVKKGEKGIPLPVVVETEADEEQEERRMLRTSYVFCRCQTTERT